MRIRKILAQAVKEVAEEDGIPEEEIWRAIPKILRKSLKF